MPGSEWTGAFVSGRSLGRERKLNLLLHVSQANALPSVGQHVHRKQPLCLVSQAASSRQHCRRLDWMGLDQLCWLCEFSSIRAEKDDQYLLPAAAVPLGAQPQPPIWQ